MAPFLAFEDEASLFQSFATLVARNVWKFLQTAISIASNPSSGTGKFSCLQGFDVDVDSLKNVNERLFFRLALANTAGQTWDFGYP